MNPWRFQANPEVYLLVAFLIGAYIYMVRAIGPVTRRHVACFTGAMVLLFVASTWPVHQLAERYLYSAHMVQHMVLSYFMPPLLLLATPEWLLRALIGDGRTYRTVSRLATPVVAGVLFNVVVVVTHIPGAVNASVDSAVVHYGLHVLLVSSALLMWLPVIGPLPELRMGIGATMIYLFLQSVVPTVPAGWLTFAEGTVYERYRQPVRVWGLSVTDDQQLAGAVMKLGGSAFLWTIVIVLFFTRFETTRTITPSERARPPASA